jgi:outer membrane protein
MRTRGLVACFACLAAVASAEDRGSRLALSYDEALRRALSANPAVGKARAEVGFADAQRRTALSFVMPRVQATGGLIRNSTEVAFGFGDSQRVILPENDWNLRITLTQPIFAGFRDLRTYAQAKEAVRAAEQGVRAAEDRILLKVSADYLSVVQGDALMAVESQSVELARRRLKEAKDLFEAGEVTQVDVLRAESSVKAAERRLVLARREREASSGQLRLDLGLDGDFDVSEPEPTLPTRPPEAELLARADDVRAEVHLAKSGLRVAQLEVSKQKGAYFPIVSADAGFIQQRTTFPADRYGYAALRLNVPIWQSGEVGARVAAARERQRQAELSLEDTRRTVREEVLRALLDAETATVSLALSQEQLAASEAEYRQVFELYRGQEATSLDLQASEATLADARRAVVNSRLARILAELGVYFAAGDLRSVVIKEVHP